MSAEILQPDKFGGLTGRRVKSDYHKSMEAYFDVKTRLFTGHPGSEPKVAIVNVDDPHGAQLVDKILAAVPAARVVTYGEHASARVRAENVALNFKNTTGMNLSQGPNIPLQVR